MRDLIFLVAPLLATTFAKASQHPASSGDDSKKYGRVSETEYVLTPAQISNFFNAGLATLPDLLTPSEMDYIESVFDKFLSREIPVPGKDFCDMSKPFGTPFEQWSIVNCMLPTRYYPPFQNNIYEMLTQSITRQLFPTKNMTKDYDQFLNKRPGKNDAVFAWHQDMAYWPGPKALGVSDTSTITFSLAVDDSVEENGCLKYVRGSGVQKTLRPHRPLGKSRDDAHALVTSVGGDDDVEFAPCPRGSATIHDEYVVHGSGGNLMEDRQRRTYVLAYRAGEIVEAERGIGFTHSHNDDVNWDTFEDGQKRSNEL
mmetsp:Transcript_11569/g.14347  ORF Transcript_11569/g.14347 Transcript_11569/m.14347 type:complete len:313 (+) Transcript_11569:48-986(+)|eukprot:CAMPEP_0172508504 /NCGR_PEP_ID=MMETSP1066-20121228/212517_1 /TAXON_ID=671091 /ORGANISM="Coscinodiscus wailesii, Strain CCMP2513" /LENGTH=312 /DNA_ID=CAMNT_0013286507 /DNA_START=37 /DNA_END=975 /DNA_ORIENTATION=+